MTVERERSDRIVTASKPRVRGFAPWRPNAQSLITVKAVEGVLLTYAAYLPMTNRQVFYRLVAEGVVGKTERAYKRLCEKINRAKRAQLLDWDSFRDDGVQITRPPGDASKTQIESYIDHAMQAGINRMIWQPVLQIVYCEAGGMVPMLERVADGFGAEVWSAGGFDGSQARYALAQRVATVDKPVIVHHIGDFDPSGVHVFQSLAEDVEALVLALGGAVTFKRLAITPEQIGTYSLPTAPLKKGDARSFEGSGTAQAEALPPDILAGIVRNALDGSFDRNADKAGEAQSREIVESVVRKYGRLA